MKPKPGKPCIREIYYLILTIFKRLLYQILITQYPYFHYLIGVNTDTELSTMGDLLEYYNILYIPVSC